MNYFKLWASIIFALNLIACSSSNQQDLSLYYWGDYTDGVYAYAEQKFELHKEITRLEKIMATAKQKNKATPPGLRAHLAVLYLHAGNDAQALSLFEEEKSHFPASATFIDFQRKGLAQTRSQQKEVK